MSLVHDRGGVDVGRSCKFCWKQPTCARAAGATRTELPEKEVSLRRWLAAQGATEPWIRAEFIVPAVCKCTPLTSLGNPGQARSDLSKQADCSRYGGNACSSNQIRTGSDPPMVEGCRRCVKYCAVVHSQLKRMLERWDGCNIQKISAPA